MNGYDMEKLANVQAALKKPSIAKWYQEEHQIGVKSFDCYNVVTYGCGPSALGEMADLILADMEIYKAAAALGRKGGRTI